MKLAILCPHGARSGGPEALHQLAHVVNEVSPGSGYICYHDRTEESVTYEDFNKYNFLEVSRDEIDDDFVVVLPEVYPDFVETFKQPVYFWWLSAIHCPTDKFPLLSNVHGHLAQSHYAVAHVRQNFNREALLLSDYIHPAFYEYKTVEKKKQIVVNPAKREDLCNDFIELVTDVPVIKLQNMTRSEVADVLRESSVFVDFGEQPGKDRIPREALLSGCLPIIRRAGAARFFNDVPIPRQYLFDTVEEAVNVSFSVLDNYTKCALHFHEYLESVKKEYDVFRRQVATFLQIID